MSRQPVIPVREFRERVERTRHVMREHRLDLLLVFSTEAEPANVRYYSDYWPSFETAAVLIPADAAPALLIGPESGTFAAARSRIPRIIKMRDFRESSQPDYPGSSLPTWPDIFREFKAHRLGIAGWHMFPQAIREAMEQALPAKRVILNADNIVRQVTMTKSKNELDCLREAARISELGFKAVLESIRPGMTECQLAGVAIGAMMGAGAESTGYPVWCCSGPNSTQAISRPTHRKVRRGEIIHFSIGAKVSGYSASIGRPVVLGTCPRKTREFLQVGLDAEKLTIELMRGGAVAGAVATRVQEFIRDRGYGHTILYGPAHACGQMECEFPFVETSSTFALEENMVFMVDIFLADRNRGFRWEDGIIIKRGHAEELSSYRRRLNILEV